MTKEDHILFWKNSAEDNWSMVLYCIEGKKNLEALFFIHLTIEKLLKANWIRDNFGNTPPLSHELQKIHSDTMLGNDAEWYDLYMIINSWNIETRYPDYKNTLRKMANSKYMELHLDKIKTLRTWLLSRL